MVSAPLAGKERCVPKSAEEWLCGENVTEADAVPVARTTDASQPPAFLRAPGGNFDAPPETATTPAPRPEEPDSTSSTVSDATATPAADYAVQLALASSARGFPALIQKLGLSAAQTQTLTLRDGRVVLLLGGFDSLDAARAAIPAGAQGAFARAVRELDTASN